MDREDQINALARQIQNLAKSGRDLSLPQDQATAIKAVKLYALMSDDLLTANVRIHNLLYSKTSTLALTHMLTVLRAMQANNGGPLVDVMIEWAEAGLGLGLAEPSAQKLALLREYMQNGGTPSIENANGLSITPEMFEAVETEVREHGFDKEG